MKTRPPADYKTAFAIFTGLGGLMLVGTTVLDTINPNLTIASSVFTTGAIVFLFLASLNYSKYKLRPRRSVPC
jgi:hypothetical protein